MPIPARRSHCGPAGGDENEEQPATSRRGGRLPRGGSVGRRAMAARGLSTTGMGVRSLPMPQSLIERLAEAPLVADGAMGTMLYAKGVYINRCYDEVILQAPELVRDVHARVRAGGRRAHPDEHVRCESRAARARTDSRSTPRRSTCRPRGSRARRPATSVIVAGSIGPARHPHRALGTDAAWRRRRRSSGGRRGPSLEGGVDAFLLETFGDLSEVHAAMEGVRDAGARTSRSSSR